MNELIDCRVVPFKKVQCGSCSCLKHGRQVRRGRSKLSCLYSRDSVSDEQLAELLTLTLLTKYVPTRRSLNSHIISFIVTEYMGQTMDKQQTRL